MVSMSALKRRSCIRCSKPIQLCASTPDGTNRFDGPRLPSDIAVPSSAGYRADGQPKGSPPTSTAISADATTVASLRPGLIGRRKLNDYGRSSSATADPRQRESQFVAPRHRRDGKVAIFDDQPA